MSRVLKLKNCTGADRCATIRSMQTEDAAGGTDGGRGLDELHSQPIGRGHQLYPGSEDPS